MTILEVITKEKAKEQPDQALIRVLENMHATQQQSKKNTLKDLGEELTQVTKTVTTKCEKCNGSGFTLRINDMGYEVARQCECYKERVIESRIAFADIPAVFRDMTINSFDTTLYKTNEGVYQAEVAKKMCINFVKEFEKMKELNKGLYLHSHTPGSGKTRMAVSIGNALIKRMNTPVKFASTVQILNEIKRTFGDNDLNESDLLDSLIRVPVIILDDIGTEKAGKWVDDRFFSILDEREKQGKITIFTSNYRIEELDLHDKIVSRIQKMSVPIQFPEESVRGYIASEENQKYTDMLLGVNR